MCRGCQLGGGRKQGHRVQRSRSALACVCVCRPVCTHAFLATGPVDVRVCSDYAGCMSYCICLHKDVKCVILFTGRYTVHGDSWRWGQRGLASGSEDGGRLTFYPSFTNVHRHVQFLFWCVDTNIHLMTGRRGTYTRKCAEDGGNFSSFICLCTH